MSSVCASIRLLRDFFKQVTVWMTNKHFDSILATPDTHTQPPCISILFWVWMQPHVKRAWEILPPVSELRIVSSYVRSVKQKRGQKEWTGRQKEEWERERDQMLGWQHRASHYLKWQQLKFTWRKTSPETGEDQESESKNRETVTQERVNQG